MQYLCLTLIASASESEAAFKSRLTAFWSHLIRTQPETYAAVYAEATHFGITDGHVTRQYMVASDAVNAVKASASASGMATAPVDSDDTYTKYEVSGSEWFQIPH